VTSTTLRLDKNEVLSLVNALEATHTHYLEGEELETHYRMLKRLERALDRVLED